MAGLFQEFNPLMMLASNQHGLAGTNTITKGSLISFHYPRSFAVVPNIIHDPYPMVILTDIWPNYIRGLNLHYLTFPYVKRILQNYGGNGGFNYQMHIKADKYMANAFRMYNRRGVMRPRRMDSEWLKTVLQSVRSFAPGEIEKIRASIQQQIQARLQAKANQLTSYDEWRKSLQKGQRQQLNRKVFGINQAVTRGPEADLIKPNEGPQGMPPANFPPLPGEGGIYSTNPEE